MVEQKPGLQLLSCDLIPRILKGEPRRGDVGLSEGAARPPPACSALAAGTSVQKAMCDPIQQLDLPAIGRTQLLHISRDVRFQRRPGGVGEATIEASPRTA